MSALCFVDTNLLVYARDASEAAKQPQAHAWLTALWDGRCGRTSVQVLNEYYVSVTRKLDPGLSAEQAWRDVRDLLAWHPLALDEQVMVRAWDLTRRFALSWWDALVVGAAQGCACAYLLTEDLQDGQEFDGTRVVNPFTCTPETLLTTGGPPAPQPP